MKSAVSLSPLWILKAVVPPLTAAATPGNKDNSDSTTVTKPTLISQKLMSSCLLVVTLLIAPNA